MKHFSAPILALLVCGGAHAAVFKYVDAATRIANYSNFRPRGYAARELLPPPPPRAKSEPRFKQEPHLKQVPDVVGSVGAQAFPRVDPQRQRAMDVDRKQIIGDELAAEQAALRLAMGRNAAPDVLGRHRADVAALERELARLK
ncbi:hypothetical protein AAKU55_003587 [Oxalobacteraceae bacterium GrIS 1.11]